MSKVSLTRFLYYKDEVKISFRSLLKKNKEKSMFGLVNIIMMDTKKNHGYYYLKYIMILFTK